MKNRILLTGGTGLLGRAIAADFKERADITHFSRRDPADGNAWIEGDIRDREALTKACAGMDAIVHAAALHAKSWEAAGDDAAFEVNVNGTKNVLEAALTHDIERVVFTSSIWAVGHGGDAPVLPHDETSAWEPRERYGMTKKLGEALCSYCADAHGLNIIVLRPGFILPPDAYSPHSAIYLFGGVDVRDVAQAHRLALEAPESLTYGVYIITADSPLARFSKDAYRTDPRGCFLKALPGSESLIEDGTINPDDFVEWYSIEKAKRELGYAPEFGFRVIP